MINLERSVDRLTHMTTSFAHLGLSFERVPAVDLTCEELIEDGRIHTAVGKRELTMAEIGCFLSHRRCWQLVARGPDPYAAIFEDDILMSDSARDLLRVSDWTPRDLDVVKLETLLTDCILQQPQIRINSNFSVCRLLSDHGGAAAYIISRKHSQYMLQNSSLLVPVDNALFDRKCPTSYGKNIYQVIPAPCIQASTLNKEAPLFGSLIDKQRNLSKSTFRSNRGPRNDKKKKEAKAQTRTRARRLIALVLRRWVPKPGRCSTSEAFPRHPVPVTKDLGMVYRHEGKGN